MELIVLRILHIVSGIIWVGAVAYNGFFIFPAVQEAGPGGGAVMQGLLKRKVPVIIPILAVITMLAGLRLLQKASGGFASGFFSTPVGMSYGISALIVFLAFGHGMATARPMTVKIGKLVGQKKEPGANEAALDAEIKTLQAKLGFNMKITAVLLLIAAAGMAVSRYM